MERGLRRIFYAFEEACSIVGRGPDTSWDIFSDGGFVRRVRDTRHWYNRDEVVETTGRMAPEDFERLCSLLEDHFEEAEMGKSAFDCSRWEMCNYYRGRCKKSGFILGASYPLNQIAWLLKHMK